MVVAMPTLEVTFVCDCKTEPGESLYLVGSAPELGSWVAAAGLLMETRVEEYPTWTSPPVKLSTTTDAGMVEYKYVKGGPRGFHWEPGRNRTIALGDCAGPDVESTTIQDGHFNIPEKGRVSANRISRIRSCTESSLSSEDTYAGKIDMTRSVTEPVKLLEERQEQEQKLAVREKDVQRLQSELESLRFDRSETDRLRSALESERTDRARSRARKRELSRDRKKKLEEQNSRSVQLEGELQKAKVAKAEADKLKADLERERRDRASSRSRHQTRTRELERLAEERAAEERSERDRAEKAQVNLKATPLAEWQVQACAILADDVKSLREASRQLTKAAAAEMQAASSLRQAQRQVLEAELELLEQGLAAGGQGQALIEPEPAKQEREAKQQGRLAEQARAESERQNMELIAEARRLRRRLQHVRAPRARRTGALLLGGAIVVLAAVGVAATFLSGHQPPESRSIWQWGATN